MIEFSASGILLDIEGTTSSIRFVFETMFPYVRRELRSFLSEHFADEEIQQAAGEIASDGGFNSLDELAAQLELAPAEALAVEVERQMDADLKATGLKKLQGAIWESGFKSGELTGHLYPEVAETLRTWHGQGLRLRIYSSGSVAAQKLFFGHSMEGDLLDLFEGHDDTTIGSKKDASSYQVISDKFKLVPAEILFISDSLAELDAASSAGLQVVWSCRPENPTAENQQNYPAIESFSELKISPIETEIS